MYTITINSFYTECKLDNDDNWEEKLNYAVKHFDLFKVYVQQMWIDDDSWPNLTD